MILYTLCDVGSSTDNNPEYLISAKDENNSQMVYNSDMVEQTLASDFEPLGKDVSPQRTQREQRDDITIMGIKLGGGV